MSNHLEPIADHVLDAIANGEAPTTSTVLEAYHLSSAISLKRIADALWGTDDTSGVLQLLNPLDIRNNY